MVLDMLCVKSTLCSPEIRFAPAEQVLSIRGESYPENSFAFYQPVFEAVEAYLRDSDAPLTLDLAVSYLNTSSIKCVIDLLERLDQAHRAGRKVVVEWHYDAENERAHEMAEEFMEDVSFPFRLVAA